MTRIGVGAFVCYHSRAAKYADPTPRPGRLIGRVVAVLVSPFCRVEWLNAPSNWTNNGLPLRTGELASTVVPYVDLREVSPLEVLAHESELRL